MIHLGPGRGRCNCGAPGPDVGRLHPVRDHIQPRRLAWRDFLKDDYLPVAPQTPGLVHRPGGRDIYAWLVRGYTTTDLTPEQVHQIGLDEVDRIRARMEIEMRAAGWTGDFPGFLTFLRTDPQFYASTREELLEKASEMAKRADDGLPALFGTLPRLPYGVRPVPAEIEAKYNEYYDNVRTPANLELSGCIAVRRYHAVEGGPKYTTVYEFEHETVPESQDWRTRSAQDGMHDYIGGTYVIKRERH